MKQRAIERVRPLKRRKEIQGEYFRYIKGTKAHIYKKNSCPELRSLSTDEQE